MLCHSNHRESCPMLRQPPRHASQHSSTAAHTHTDSPPLPPHRPTIVFLGFLFFFVFPPLPFLLFHFEGAKRRVSPHLVTLPVVAQRHAARIAAILR
ncbi:uncharacterized protein LY79DRAFT_10595 [Colletotrichum navitas]|uniref:Uncharacterized protein n=1 Tax=Colletotrichum navitas TaxID=681940 RepID=A0AAD8QCS1_9PEZI|nr:uncharacterized protein LY79DRAFT_10595 [Colletotrichum navitas]KAK1600203.1 hypothetical protein LY79DRAFT_10595 [Colletotrichum navitas]